MRILYHLLNLAICNTLVLYKKIMDEDKNRGRFSYRHLYTIGKPSLVKRVVAQAPFLSR